MTSTSATSVTSARLALGVCCIGHAFSHMFQPIFYVVALALERELGLTHGAVVGLIVVGNVLFGAAAPFAGWLGDRWSASAMLLIYFVGCGTAMILIGTATSPFAIAAWLAVTGLFASIYHPVGFAWLVRNAVNRGTALGLAGVFGGLGPAAAALVAGVLVDGVGWRAAFMVPGAVVLMVGAAFWWLLARRLVVDSKVDRRTDAPATRGDALRTILVLLVTVVSTGLIYNATQAAMPKLFSERVAGAGERGLFDLSLWIAFVYFVAGGMQVVAGWLSDRFSMKSVYVISFLVQVPFLLLAAQLGGAILVIVALVMVSSNVATFPPENSLIARFTPTHWRGVAYGLKFVVIFGVGGLGAMLDGALYDLTGDFFWLFVTLAALALVAFAAGLGLPAERPAQAAVAE